MTSQVSSVWPSLKSTSKKIAKPQHLSATCIHKNKSLIFHSRKQNEKKRITEEHQWKLLLDFVVDAEKMERMKSYKWWDNREVLFFLELVGYKKHLQTLWGGWSFTSNCNNNKLPSKNKTPFFFLSHLISTKTKLRKLKFRDGENIRFI